jgi:FKBP-type peptidyl-prolyl cis-trans isomerase 2
VTVVEVTPYSVVVDGSHPLAGQAVVEVAIISVDSSANANADRPQFDLGGES